MYNNWAGYMPKINVYLICAFYFTENFMHGFWIFLDIIIHADYV